MSIKTLAFSLLIAFAVSSPALAKRNNTCGVGSKYKLIDTTLVPYGLTSKEALKKAKQAFKGYNVQGLKDGGVLISFNRPYQNLDHIAFYTNNDVVTRILFSYHNDFINSVGGLGDALTLLAKKLMEKYGKADGVDTSGEGGKYTATWGENGGVSLKLILKQPSTLLLRFDCKSLEKKLFEEKAKSANFGF